MAVRLLCRWYLIFHVVWMLGLVLTPDSHLRWLMAFNTVGFLVVFYRELILATVNETLATVGMWSELGSKPGPQTDEGRRQPER